MLLLLVFPARCRARIARRRNNSRRRSARSSCWVGLGLAGPDGSTEKGLRAPPIGTVPRRLLWGTAPLLASPLSLPLLFTLPVSAALVVSPALALPLVLSMAPL